MNLHKLFLKEPEAVDDYVREIQDIFRQERLPPMHTVVTNYVIDLPWINEIVGFKNGHGVGVGYKILYNPNLIFKWNLRIRNHTA